MAELYDSMMGVVLTTETLDRIKAVLAAMSARAAQKQLDAISALPKGEYGPWGNADNVAWSRERAEQGSDTKTNVRAEFDAFTTRDGVVYPQARYVDLSRLDEGYTSATVSIFGWDSLVCRLESHSKGHLAIRLSGEESDITAMKPDVIAILNETVDWSTLESRLPPFKVFIGHGRDPQWKYLKRILEENHGFNVDAFEAVERAGYLTLTSIDMMVRASSVALVVMTGEDEMKDGSRRARENVVHEVGFCQGALGMQNTIILLEEGVSEFSNIAGMTQIRFPKHDLLSVEEKVVAALQQRREAHNFVHSGRDS